MVVRTEPLSKSDAFYGWTFGLFMLCMLAASIKSAVNADTSAHSEAYKAGYYTSSYGISGLLLWGCSAVAQGKRWGFWVCGLFSAFALAAIAAVVAQANRIPWSNLATALPFLLFLLYCLTRRSGLAEEPGPVFDFAVPPRIAFATLMGGQDSAVPGPPPPPPPNLPPQRPDAFPEQDPLSEEEENTRARKAFGGDEPSA